MKALLAAALLAVLIPLTVPQASLARGFSGGGGRGFGGGGFGGGGGRSFGGGNFGGGGGGRSFGGGNFGGGGGRDFGGGSFGGGGRDFGGGSVGGGNFGGGGRDFGGGSFGGGNFGGGGRDFGGGSFGGSNFGGSRGFQNNQFGNNNVGNRGFENNRGFQNNQVGNNNVGNRSFENNRGFQNNQVGNNNVGNRNIENNRGFQNNQIGNNNVGNRNIENNRGFQNNQIGNNNIGNRAVVNDNHYNNFAGNGNWHQNYWNGHWNNWGGYWGGHWGPGYGYGGFGYGLGTGLGYGLGAGVGYGMLGWGMGSWPYTYGYSSYVNPYYVASPAVVASPVYNYSTPIAVDSPAPEQSAVDSGTSNFDAARAAFQSGDYGQALTLSEQALQQLPSDVDLHQFRAIALFALGRYDDATGAIYAVLTAGPGWSWATLVGLYPNVDVYTTQLRALESYRNNHNDQAGPHFLLGYLYTTMGSNDAAARELRQVVQLQPNDRLSASLLARLTGASSGDGSGGEAPAAPSNPSPTPTPTTPPPTMMAGTWNAKGADNSQVQLALKPDGTFTWTANVQGTPRSFSGQYTAGNDLLTLARVDGQAIVGKIWGEGTGFHFTIAGSGAGDPGLSFQR